MQAVQADAVMPPPRVRPWFNTLDVSVDVDVAVEVHVGTEEGFTPTVDTFKTVLYGPGLVHVTDMPPEIDYYVRFVAPGDDSDISETSIPVRTIPLTNG